MFFQPAFFSAAFVSKTELYSQLLKPSIKVRAGSGRGGSVHLVKFPRSFHRSEWLDQTDFTRKNCRIWLWELAEWSMSESMLILLMVQKSWKNHLRLVVYPITFFWFYTSQVVQDFFHHEYQLYIPQTISFFPISSTCLLEGWMEYMTWFDRKLHRISKVRSSLPHPHHLPEPWFTNSISKVCRLVFPASTSSTIIFILQSGQVGITYTLYRLPHTADSVYTPPKTNMTIANPPFEDVSPIFTWAFSNVMLVFRGVHLFQWSICLKFTIPSWWISFLFGKLPCLKCHL